MEGIIASFRRNRHTTSSNHMIVEVDGVDRKDKAVSLVGKEVLWKSPAKKEIKGKVASTHGNKGAVRVIFEKGMPGQSIGTKVAIK
jgi:large subunit ribosomal protein L35Ae